MPLDHNNSIPLVNPGERHVAAVLLLDVSGSMKGEAIEELNRGLVEFYNALHEDPLALGRVDLCIITFSETVEKIINWRPAVDFQPIVLDAHGFTSLNQAYLMGLDAIAQRKQEYRKTGTGYYRSWFIALTDGVPTDVEYQEQATNALQSAIRENKVTYIPIAIGDDCDISQLQSYYPEEANVKPILRAKKTSFKEAFQWLSASMSLVCKSNPITQKSLELPPTPQNITIGL